MAVSVIDLLYNVTGQTVYFDCPEGRPSAVASMTLYKSGTGDDGTAEAALDTPAVETNPNTTFDGNSGYGQSDPTLCALSSVTGITVGRRYLATNALGETDWIEAQGVTTGASINAKDPLKNAYVSGDAFESTRITAAVLDAWIQDNTNLTDDLDPNPGYRLRVQYTVSSVVYVHQAGVNVVRYVGTHTVTAADMRSFRPQWSYHLPTYHQEDDGARVLDEAYDELRWDLHRAQVPAEMIRNQAAVDHGVKLLAWKNLTALGDDEDAQTDARIRYQAFLDGLFRITATAAKATDSSGAGRRSTAVSLWEK